MADSLDDRHGTSDEFSDPYCDLCFISHGLNVKVRGYCKECFQFLCTDCHIIHGNLQETRGHTVLRGEDMPQSQATKPPRFEDCEVHPKHVMDQFCFEHQILLCSSCISSNHKSCSASSVTDACQDIQPSEIDTLYDNLSDLRKGFEKISSAVDDNMKSLVQEKERILEEAQTLYQKVISKANKLIQELKKDVDAKYQSSLSVLSANQKRINDAISSLDVSLNQVANEKDKCIDIKLFLRIHDALRDKDLLKSHIEYFNRSLCKVSMSFAPSDVMQGFLSSSSATGTISGEISPLNLSIGIPDIHFPPPSVVPTSAKVLSALPLDSRQSESSGATKTEEGPRQIAMTQPRKLETYQIDMECQRDDCWITGIALTDNDRILLTDFNHCKVKLFSREMKLLSSLSLSNNVWDVEMTGDHESVVSTYHRKLVFLHISDKLAIKRKLRLSFIINGITRYKDNLVVTCPHTVPPTVKLIDMAGKVIWSLSTGDTGQPLFNTPWYVSSFADGKSSSVIVTDKDTDKMALVNGDTGEVITIRQLEKMKWPRGVTTDSAGNVYVCYGGTGEVAILSGDLSKEKILLSGLQGLKRYPQNIAFDEMSKQFVISYNRERSIDIYQF